MSVKRVPFHSQEARALANRGPAWREHPSYYLPDPPDDPVDECDRLHCNDTIGPCANCPNIKIANTP